MRPAWRLIVDGPVDGALNMALDQAAQQCREEDIVPPTLRLYRWVRPTVTLGHFQDESDVDREVCQAYGIDVTRRPTGGRGVLHDDELTYSVVASEADGIPRGVAASYRCLSAALARAYAELGIDAGITTHDRASAPSAACYLATTRADLSLGASKLSGSAQVWKGSTVLQHGSFTRTRDVRLEAAVFRLSPEQERRLECEATTIAAVLGKAPAIPRIEDAIVRAFAEEFEITLRKGEWSAEEAAIAERILQESD